MDHDCKLYIATLLSAFIISLLTTPIAKKISVKLGAVDYPKARGMHKVPIPRLGGISIILGFMITILSITPFVLDLQVKQMIGFILGALIIVALGIVDDIKNLKAKYKLCFQIIAALIAIFSDIRVNVVWFSYTEILETFSIPITLIWIIGVTNAVNLIDGLDGLAAGVSSIASICIMILCILTGSPLAVVLTSTLAGSCLGFLPRNFSPAEIFMGDTGATFLGYVLAVSSIIGVFKGYAVLAVIVAVLCIGLPIFDTFFAMLRRIIKRRPVMQADRGHLHHKLIDKGFSQKQTVLMLYSVSAFCGITAILIVVEDYLATLITVVSIIVCALMVFVYNKRNKENINAINEKTITDLNKD